MSSVPPVDAEPQSTDANETRFSAMEFRLLDADARAKENVNREADQRYWLRWLAVVIVLLLIITMVLLLGHVAHSLPYFKVMGAPPAFYVVAFVSPVVSMSALGLSLLVAAFRGYKDEDGQAGAGVASAASEGAKALGLTS